jgi:hypothetical protein
MLLNSAGRCQWRGLWGQQGVPPLLSLVASLPCLASRSLAECTLPPLPPNQTHPPEGPLKSAEEDDPATDDVAAAPARSWWTPLAEGVVGVVKRGVLFLAFQRARQPERIREGELLML